MLAVGLHMFYNQTTALIAVCDAHVNLMAGTLNIKSLLSFLLHYTHAVLGMDIHGGF